MGDGEGEPAIRDVIEEDSEWDNDTDEVKIGSLNHMNDTSSPNFNEEGSCLNEGRTRRRLVWMDDCENGEGFFREKDMAHMVLFAFVVSMYFEEAVKSEKCRITMDFENKAIENNDT